MKRKTKPNGKQQTYWVLEKRQILCLASARRHDIIDKFVATGPMSIRELAPLMGASPASLYHHIEKLKSVGLIVPAGHRVVNRRREQIYATPAPRMRMELFKAFADPANRSAVDKVGRALARQFERDFHAGLRSDQANIGGPHRNLALARLVGAPDKGGMAKINRHFDAIAEILWRSRGRKGPLVAFAWTVAPVGRKRP
jgi:DNA-binding transcriptional ArsR family regulator